MKRRLTFIIFILLALSVYAQNVTPKISQPEVKELLKALGPKNDDTVRTDHPLKTFENSRYRIYAMSHTQQYKPELGTSLDESIVWIIFKLKIDLIGLNLSHAVRLGLIINEAVTNSIKYAQKNYLRSGESKNTLYA